MFELEKKSLRYSLFSIVTNDEFTVKEIRQRVADFGGEEIRNLPSANGMEIILECRILLIGLLNGVRGDYKVLAKRSAQQRNFRPIYTHESEEIYFAD